MRINDQVAAIKLAICDDIGERSYDATDVAAILVQLLLKLPEVGMVLFIWVFPVELLVGGCYNYINPKLWEVIAGPEAIYKRYKIKADGSCGKM